MRYLLDTHAVIWILDDSPRLPSGMSKIIRHRENSIYLSSVSLWEIAIKTGAGKLKMRFTFDELLDEVKNSIMIYLPIQDEHLRRLITLPFLHKDPFDRLLISTACAENLTIITADADIHRYNVPWIWHP